MKKDNQYSTVKNILRETSFFEDFSDEELDFIKQYLNLRYFPEKTVLFKEGDIGDYLFFIVEGSVEVRIDSKKTKQFVIAAFSHGACVGEMSIIDDFPRSATIIATEATELLLLTKFRFQKICKDNPDLGIKFLTGIARNLSARLRKTTGRFADVI